MSMFGFLIASFVRITQSNPLYPFFHLAHIEVKKETNGPTYRNRGEFVSGHSGKVIQFNGFGTRRHSGSLLV